MNEDTKAYANRLKATYESEAPEPPADVVVPDVFWYLHFKAFAFLNAGPHEYRSYDALHQPPEHLSATRLHETRRGCQQILQFRGLSPERPLEDLGVGGFYALLRLLHFLVDQRASLHQAAEGKVLDQMKMRHVAGDREVTLYNLVTVNLPRKRIAGKRIANGPPCPHCGELLRTPFAKQCRHCGMDWHDPTNVVNRKPMSSL